MINMLGRDHVIASMSIAATGLLWVDHGILVDQHVFGSIALLASTGAGALAPDLDSANSIASQKWGSFLSKVFQHRGFMHSIFGWLVWSWLWLWLLHLVFNTTWQAGPESFTWMIWFGLTLGYFLHLLEDSWSVAGVRWFNPITPYDEWSYDNYHVLLRPVNHWDEDEDGHKIPIRHWWGRGYVVGSDDELAITGVFFLLAIAALIRAMFF